ncbi:hypothetical protein ALC57_14091 [Trachymyrmex cornetzi]|uniref:Uncharacterized protein n=1 Tax=Trachymyrmex cornetzi TaxID=471704 RepID=A0A151IYQ3_9HYME|nr:hypothetical protein ALC57_14091 [Trachymyrmex cornetzi]
MQIKDLHLVMCTRDDWSFQSASTATVIAVHLQLSPPYTMYRISQSCVYMCINYA